MFMIKKMQLNSWHLNPVIAYVILHIECGKRWLYVNVHLILKLAKVFIFRLISNLRLANLSVDVEKESTQQVSGRRSYNGGCVEDPWENRSQISES